MRKLKFRAWDKRKRIMVYQNENESADYWDGVYASEVQLINALLDSPLYEFMQYTGLKDKNGEDIYEGDILRDNDCFLWEVYWEDGAFLVRGGEFDEIELLIDLAPNWCEVVGNIFEKPWEANGNARD